MRHRENPDYLEFVRRHHSATWWGGRAAGSVPSPEEVHPTDEPLSVAHHVRIRTDGGTGLKPTDYFSVPLSDEEHKRLHAIGEETFWREVGVDPFCVILDLLDIWGLRHGLNVRPVDYGLGAVSAKQWVEVFAAAAPLRFR